jgi:hypothetical protein
MSLRTKSSVISIPLNYVGGSEKKGSKKSSKKSSKKESKKSSKKESKPKKEKLYCGVQEPLPKTYTKFGTMKDCAEKNQVKRYGRYKVDSKKIVEKENKETKLKLFAKRGKLMGMVSRFKRLLKNPKLVGKEKQDMKDKANVIIREINALDIIIKKL